MKTLRPNSRGVVEAQKRPHKAGGHLTIYTKSTNLLRNIDGLLHGEKPRICITRKQGGIGDVLMMTPVIRNIARRYGVKIDFGTDPEYLDGALVKVMQNNPWVEKITHWRDADPEQYHGIIDLTCPCVAYEKPGVRPRNRVDLFADHLGIKLEDHYLDYVITPEEDQWARDYIAENNLGQRTLIFVNPSSAAERRSAPVDKMKKAVSSVLGTKKNMRALIVTHTSDNEVSDWNYNDTHILNNLDVRQLAAIMKHCALVLCPDSALLHVACALHMPTVTLFGPTDPRARINYHPEAVAIWPGKDLKGYPVWYDDVDPGLLCWKRLEVYDISNTMLAMLSGKPLPPSSDLVTFGNFKQDNQLYQIL